jgi:hypothetical protein
MPATASRARSCLGAALLLFALGSGPAAIAQSGRAYFLPNNLLLSRVIYDNKRSNVVVGMQLPPGCAPANCVSAFTDGTYPYVWNNAFVDSSFGITAKIILDQLTPFGMPINSLEVPNSSQKGVPSTKNQMVTSFSSKSELALDMSTAGQSVSFMGYLAPINALDVSNSNTPGVVDPTNPVLGLNYRVVAQINAKGKFHFTATNAYSGNNGRAAILNADDGVLYAAGNAGNGNNPQPDGVILGAGAQILTPQLNPLVAQSPGLPTPVGSFNITELGDKPDKIGKDTNFRGLRVFDNVLYYTKGSGGNGVNTVYFIDTSGSNSSGNPLACPDGTGLPSASASLPTAPIEYDPSVLQTKGVFPYNMCVLNGFPTALSSKTSFPFGVWFADADTLYVADEGNGTNTYDPGTNTYTAAAAQTSAGLQKWVFNDGKWSLAYTLTVGLNLGQPYTVPGYPSGDNFVTSLPWSPATDGLRNIIGRNDGNGTATIWAITSTVSGNGDQGADPNKLVVITDTIAATTLPRTEMFRTLRSASFGEVLRGVSFTPGTSVTRR